MLFLGIHIGNTLLQVRRMKKTGASQRFRDSQRTVSGAEAFLLALAVVQVGLAVVGELWIGVLGLGGTAEAAGCAVTAPVWFDFAQGIGAYEFWIVVVWLVALIRTVV